METEKVHDKPSKEPETPEKVTQEDEDEVDAAARKQDIMEAKDDETGTMEHEETHEVTPKIRNRRWKKPNTRRGRKLTRRSRSHRRRSFSSSSSSSGSSSSDVDNDSTSDSDSLGSVYSSTRTKNKSFLSNYAKLPKATIPNNKNNIIPSTSTPPAYVQTVFTERKDEIKMSTKFDYRENGTDTNYVDF